MENIKKYAAEFIGTFTLVLIGCGTAALSGVNLVATALAFGLSIVAMAYSIGKISGCHINPAVSFAMFLSKKLNGKDFLFYVLSQVAGAFMGALVVFLFTKNGAALGTNAVQRYEEFAGGTLTPFAFESYGLNIIVAIIAEVVLTFIFLIAIFGATQKENESGFAGLIIGGALTLVHLLGINITGTSVNPARSFGPAVVAMFDGNFTPIADLWVFIVAPLIGAALAAFVWKWLNKSKNEQAVNGKE